MNQYQSTFKPMKERFWEKVAKSDGCWLWMASCNENGYGCFGLPGKTMRAHRLAYELTNGPIPAGLLLRHECDNRRCVNPDHLIPGTSKQNTADMISKGRGGAQKKTHCKYGHEFTPENTAFKGHVRVCRACKSAKKNPGLR